MNKLALAAAAAMCLTACGKSADSPATTPTAAKTLHSGIERTVDPEIRAQDDLYRHVNGAWLASTEIPADKSNYGSFSKLDDDAQLQLRAIIEEAAAKTEKAVGSDEQKVGDYYAAFMNETLANELGLKPLLPELARIGAIKDKQELPELMAHLSSLGSPPLASFVDNDAQDSTRYLLYLFQGGTGLPDRDFYLSKDKKFAEIRRQYLGHVERMLALAEIKDAARNAKSIMALETALARAQWTQVDSRDTDKIYNRYALDQLNALTPGFDLLAFVNAAGAGRSPGAVVGQPSFFTAWAKLLQSTPLETLKVYLQWHLLSDYAPLLSQPFVDENFAFYGTTLNGVVENKPRWKRGVDATEGALGEVLGRIYVARHFPPEAKTRMEQLVKNLIKAYELSIKELDWMGEETRKKALEKLAKFTPKIGYPRKWKDYSALVVQADDPVGNAMRSRRVEFHRQVAKLGKPIDRDEWHMTPQTVNAYYNPGMNEIVFPAAILQPPFFDMNAEDAVNYGGIGAVIGHEIGHGFDDQGSKFDGDGNLKSWWTDEDRKNFEIRTKALIAQYDRFEPLPGHTVNGAFTIGENIGDLGGLSIAYKAYHMALNGKDAPVIDGLSADQRLFMGWAQIWARKYRDENLLQRLKTDPHAPSEYRCNGIVANIPAFYSAFDVKEGDKLYLPPEQRVKIW
jgi:putative endopeptidase